MRPNLTTLGASLLALTLFSAACKHQDKSARTESPAASDNPVSAVIAADPDETVVSATIVEPCDANAVFFEAGVTQLDDQGKDRVATLAQCIRSNDIKEIVVVEQNAPERDEDVSKALAKQRALTVANHLRELGIDESMISILDGTPSRAGEKLWPEEGMAARE